MNPNLFRIGDTKFRFKKEDVTALNINDRIVKDSLTYKILSIDELLGIYKVIARRAI